MMREKQIECVLRFHTRSPLLVVRIYKFWGRTNAFFLEAGKPLLRSYIFKEIDVGCRYYFVNVVSLKTERHSSGWYQYNGPMSISLVYQTKLK